MYISSIETISSYIRTSFCIH